MPRLRRSRRCRGPSSSDCSAKHEEDLVIRRIHHAGIVVRRLADAYAFYRETLGLALVKEAEIPDQGVRAALLSVGDSEIELLEPTRPDTGVARFLAHRGEGLHHVC